VEVKSGNRKYESSVSKRGRKGRGKKPSETNKKNKGGKGGQVRSFTIRVVNKDGKQNSKFGDQCRRKRDRSKKGRGKLGPHRLEIHSRSRMVQERVREKTGGKKMV